MNLNITKRAMRKLVKWISQAETVAEIYNMWSPIWPEEIREAMQKRLGEISQ